MTELRPGQKLERLIRVYGVEGPVVVSISEEGITFRPKGSKRHVKLSWTAAVNASSTEFDVPSYLYGKPLELLQHCASEIAKHRAEKARQEKK